MLMHQILDDVLRGEILDSECMSRHVRKAQACLLNFSLLTYT